MKRSQIRRPCCALSVVAALALSGAALAGGHPPGGEDKAKKMDTNQDGMVSAQEHAAGATAMFGQMDADGDGNVTVAEMDAGHLGMKHDGMKHDGMKHDGMKHDDGMKSGDPVAKDKMGKQPKMSSADKIKKMDSNADGMLSAAEHDAGAARKFSEMDSDGDGSLSAAEMKAGHEAMKGKRDY